MMLANSLPHRTLPASPAALELVGRSAVIARVQEVVRRSASLDSGVLIVGEPGVDAGSVARELHARSGRPAAPWTAVECGRSDVDLERALFGAPLGLTPADVESVSGDSRIAAARGGMLFLQDVDKLPAAAQARLARVARDAHVRIDRDVVATRFRLAASASPSIDGDVRESRFQADLFRCLAVSRIDLPPLRGRLEDVPSLSARLLEDLSAAAGLPPRKFAPPALALLAALSWPGNLAELREVVERVMPGQSIPGDEVIPIERLLPALQLDRASTPFVPVGLRDARLRFERDYIAAVLQHHGWRMADAARTLGIQRPNLYRKARQLGIPLTCVTD
jgi:two-component system, NtrC family, nitrogen regulation response regulator NtrX